MLQLNLSKSLRSALLLVCTIGATIGATAVHADEIIDSYSAYLSAQDHFNSSRDRLTSAAQILQQDRANFHRFDNADMEDGYDSYFTSTLRRGLMGEMVDRGELDANARKLIINSNLDVYVEIWSGDNGPYVLVSVFP